MKSWNHEKVMKKWYLQWYHQWYLRCRCLQWFLVVFSLTVFSLHIAATGSEGRLVSSSFFLPLVAPPHLHQLSWCWGRPPRTSHRFDQEVVNCVSNSRIAADVLPKVTGIALYRPIVFCYLLLTVYAGINFFIFFFLFLWLYSAKGLVIARGPSGSPVAVHIHSRTVSLISLRGQPRVASSR